MTKLEFVCGAHQEVANRVALAQGNKPRSWERFNTLSFYRVDEDGIKLVCDWLFLSLSSHDVVVHMASYSRIWAKPELLYNVFAYPFLQLRCRRITAPIAEANVAARRAAERLGFVLEGCLREADREGGNILTYGMLRGECRWLLRESANALAA